MKIAVSVDEYDPVIDTLLEELEKRGHEAMYIGPRKGKVEGEISNIPALSTDEIAKFWFYNL